MKHSETFTLRKWNILKWKHETLRNSNPQKNGHEQFSNGNVRNFDPQKNENENSHPQMHAVCRSGEKTTNQHFEEFHERMHICFFFIVWCCVLCTRKQICLIHNKGYTFSNVCCFFPQCLALCSANEKNERYQMNKWMFFKRVDDVMPAAYFFKTKTCAVYDKQMEFIKTKARTVQFCECFWWPARVFEWEELMIFCLLELSDAFWEILIFCWPFFPKKIVVSWFIDYCSLPVLASKKWTCMWNTTAWILDNCKLVHA